MCMCRDCDSFGLKVETKDLVIDWCSCPPRLESLSTAHQMPRDDKILRTKIEINERTKIEIEIARDGPILIFYECFIILSCSASSRSVGQISISSSSQLLGKIPITTQIIFSFSELELSLHS